MPPKWNQPNLAWLSTCCICFHLPKVFPALDLARLVVLIPHAADRPRANEWNRILVQAQALCQAAAQQATTLEGPAAVAIPMLTLRLYANAFKEGPGSQQAVSALVPQALALAEPLVQSASKNI